ncbi:hypothetical protein N7533_013546 [Penicillium manginii]|uniref:uncharacterized protein n=1 Tax=Penicillium manginii TaxID=203109 RepID=UPI002549495C|nr:uncharacterized protein N7533_013546 [Penicillium manginii]KAJ5733099.1 hypothetical protein N7533_013546 [Penicillium manginii]
MKYHLLCSLLAAGTLALPGNIVARSATASISPSAPATTAQTTTAETTTTTAETSTTTTESQAEATNVAICEHNGMTRENWIKYDLDKWTSFFATYFPQNVYNHDKEEFPNDVFSDYMIYQAAWGNEHCTVGDPTCDINVGDVSACKSFTGDSTMPNIYFILGAIKNFWEWSTAVSNSVRVLGASWQGRANDVVNTFTEHDVSTDSQSAGMALAGNVLTMLTPMTIMCEACSATSSLYGAASGAQAIHDAAQQSAPEM